MDLANRSNQLWAEEQYHQWQSLTNSSSFFCFCSSCRRSFHFFRSSWTTNKNSHHIHLFECHWRTSNEEVQAKVEENRQIMKTQQRQHRWIGHILRHESLLLDIIEGRMKGRPTRGRKRLQMLHMLAKDGCWQWSEKLKTGGDGVKESHECNYCSYCVLSPQFTLDKLLPHSIPDLPFSLKLDFFGEPRHNLE